MHTQILKKQGIVKECILFSKLITLPIITPQIVCFKFKLLIHKNYGIICHKISSIQSNISPPET